MYTEQMTQGLSIAGTPVHAQQLTSTTTLTSGGVDMQKFRRCLFLLNIGALGGTAPTVSAVLTIQESPDNSTWTTNGTVGTLTLSAGSKVGTSEINQSQLGAGKRYVRASIVYTIGGTSPTVPTVCVPLGGEAVEKPGSAQNDASVAAQAVTT